MAPFIFNLQPLLDLRERTEEDRKREYGIGLRLYEEAMADLRRAQEEHAESLRRLRERIMNADARAMEDAYAEVTYLRDLVARARQIADQAEQQLEAMRQRLLNATREKNVMQKLKERRHEAYLEERRLREEQEIDDANVLRIGRELLLRRDSEIL